MDISLKRIIAFCIDMVIISFITTLIVNYVPINPNHDKYQSTYDEYMEIAKEVGDDKDKAIQYEDKIIEINYKLYKYRVVDNVVSITCLILYFGLYQLLADGETLGKRVMKLKVVSNKDKKLNFGNYLLRTMLFTNIIVSLICICLVYITKGKTFYYITSVLSLVQYGLYLINILMITLKKDNRGLHDLVAGTKVIELKVNDKEEKDIETEEVKVKKESIKEKVEKKENKKKVKKK